MSVVADPNSPNQPHHGAHIRLLATTDLHGHLLPYDYIKDQPTQGGGLAGLAGLIADARAQAADASIPVVLLDNGDTFQGTPLATYLATQDVNADHPIVAALNHLSYDVLGLGNHDLDHGLPYLRAVASALNMPILNSNLRNIDMAPLQKSLLMRIDLGPSAPAPLALGVLSVLPPQSAAWQSHHLGPLTSIEDPEEVISTAAIALRDAGADLIIVLGHMGVGHADGANSDLMAAHALVRTGQIDALILGHTHRRLPSSDYAIRKGVDIHASTVGGVPTLMAGHAGSDLGMMDLSLCHDPVLGWRVVKHHCQLVPNDANVQPDKAIVTYTQSVHETVRRQLSHPVATTSTDLHSYFSLVSPAPTQHLIAVAQYLQVRTALKGGPYADLPILSSAAAHGAGGRDGPENYVHIPKGPVLQRHIAGLNPFTNQTVGALVTGAEIHRWLEHSALLFAQQSIKGPQQMLINADVPAFHFDTIFGLTYCIDLGAPPLKRITQIEYNGTAVAQGQQFILATSQFRATGGGGYAARPHDQIICRVTSPLNDSIIEALNAPAASPWLNQPCWRFASLGRTKAYILTHPDALECVEDIAHLSPKPDGSTPEGFIRLSITL